MNADMHSSISTTKRMEAKGKRNEKEQGKKTRRERKEEKEKKQEEKTNIPHITIRIKIVFVSWCPEGAGIKNRMVYAATIQTMKRLFEGIGCSVEACNSSDLSREAVLARLIK